MDELDKRFDQVYGIRERVQQGFFRNACSVGVKRTLSRLLGVGAARAMTSFRIFRSELRRAFEGRVGNHVFLDALLCWGTSRIGSVIVAHRQREGGNSGYSIGRLVAHAVGIPAGSRWNARMRSALPWVLFALCAILVWCLLFQRFPGAKSFKYPTAYAGDSMFFLGVAKGFSELPLPWNIRIQHLNAPDSADWNDYPLSEKLLYYTHGLLARYIRAGVASNILYLLAHVTAAISFLWAARRLGSQWLPGMLGACSLRFRPT